MAEHRGNQLSTTSSRASAGPPGSENPQNANRLIAGHIGKLLTHYWTPDMSPELREMQAKDWIEDLREFGPRIIEAACTEYRRTQKFRPTPADIRKLCIEEQSAQRERDQRRHALPGRGQRGEWSPEDEETYARRAGWSSALERRDAIEAQQARYRRAEDWRNETGYKPGSPVAPVRGVTETPEHTPEQMAEFQKQLGISVRKVPQ